MSDIGRRPSFFATPAEFRSWLEQQHATSEELWVGFYKKGSGTPSITWDEAVGEALCFGWIDGIRKRIDDLSYMIRFTPRKPGSTWSTVNIKRVEELTQAGRMQPAGLRAFEERSAAKSGIYSYEQRDGVQLDAADEAEFRANRQAWDFFQSQPAWYKKAAIWSVVSAKKDETRRRRLASLIEHSAQGQTLPALTRNA